MDTSLQNFVPILDEISELAIDPLPNSMTNDNSNDLDIPIAIKKRETLLYLSPYV